MIIAAFVNFQDRSSSYNVILKMGLKGWVYCVILASTSPAFVLAVSNTSVANVVFIFASMPMFTAIFSWMLLPVLAGFGYGLSSVLVRLIPDEVPSAAIQISQQLLTCILGFCFLISFDEIKPIGSINDLYLFALMGFCGGVGVLCLVISYRLADPSSVSVFEYFGIPVSFILGWLFFTEAPFSTLFPGVLLIIGAGLLIVFRERRVHRDNI